MEPAVDEDEPAPRRRRPVIAVVAVMLVLSLVLGGIIVVVDRNRGDDPASEDAGELVPPAEDELGPPPTQSELDAVVADLSAFVADARGLEFREPVTATLLDDEAFSARVREDAVADLAELGGIL